MQKNAGVANYFFRQIIHEPTCYIFCGLQWWCSLYAELGSLGIFGRVMNTNTLMVLLTGVLLGAGCSKQQAKVESPPQSDYTLSHTYTPDSFYCGQVFDLTQPYRVGMSRDELRGILGAHQLVSSQMRPLKGWRSLENDDYGVSVLASEIESSHFHTSIVVCDAYNADGNWHVLYFDDRGILVGFRRTPSMFYDSVAMK